MSFIEFTAKKTRIVDKATVSINKGGSIVFSQRCYNDYLKGFPYVKLYYDPEKKIIGIKPVAEESAHAYRITVGQDQKNAYISCVAYFKYFKIDDESRKMDTRWNKDAELIEAREMTRVPAQKTLFDR